MYLCPGLCLWPRWCSWRRRARPPARSPHASFARSGRSRSPPVPSGPNGALHTGAACRCLLLGQALRPLRCPPHRRCCVADVWFGALPCRLARCLVARAPPPPAGTAAWPPGSLGCAWSRNVTESWRHLSNFARNSPATSSNIEFASLELQRFWGVSKNDRVKLRAKFGWWWRRRSPRVPQPGPVDQVARWSETLVAFAR